MNAIVAKTLIRSLYRFNKRKKTKPYLQPRDSKVYPNIYPTRYKIYI